jgi:hypothetical protein
MSLARVERERALSGNSLARVERERVSRSDG